MNGIAEPRCEPAAGPAAEGGSAPFAAWHPARAGEPAAREPGFGRRFFRDMVRGVLIVGLLHLFVLQVSVVRGHSMEPSLLDGDRLVVDRISYSFLDVERFDVVVLRNPRNESVDYVKRVVGLPGDVVELRAGRVYIDGRPVDEKFTHIADRDTTGSLVVPDGFVYVLGDNRPISSDSREFGLVRQELLEGKVRLRVWPISRLASF